MAVTGCCFEKYKEISAALAQKRIQMQCLYIRKMLKQIKKGKGRHLISAVQPHFCSCESCQKWASSRKYDVPKILREASK